MNSNIIITQIAAEYNETQINKTLRYRFTWKELKKMDYYVKIYNLLIELGLNFRR